MATPRIKEGTTATLTMVFKDENGDLVVPDIGSYRIDDVQTGEEILGNTSFDPISSTHEVIITETDNRIVSDMKTSEVHRVTVEFTYSVNRKGADKFDIIVENLKFK